MRDWLAWGLLALLLAYVGVVVWNEVGEVSDYSDVSYLPR